MEPMIANEFYGFVFGFWVDMYCFFVDVPRFVLIWFVCYMFLDFSLSLIDSYRSSLFSRISMHFLLIYWRMLSTFVGFYWFDLILRWYSWIICSLLVFIDFHWASMILRISIDFSANATAAPDKLRKMYWKPLIL